MSERYLLSLDPAQLRDFSALAAVCMRIDPVKRKAVYDLANMERRQKLPYDQIVDWAVDAFNTKAFQPSGWDRRTQPEFLLDATGPGLALRDMLKLKGIRCKPIIITSGQAMTHNGPFIHIGKARLFGMFMAAFDSGRVQINPNMPIYPALESEMVSFRAKLSASGNALFEAGPGENDDLLFSLAMAVWYGEEVLRGAKI